LLLLDLSQMQTGLVPQKPLDEHRFPAWTPQQIREALGSRRSMGGAGEKSSQFGVEQIFGAISEDQDRYHRIKQGSDQSLINQAIQGVKQGRQEIE